MLLVEAAVRDKIEVGWMEALTGVSDQDFGKFTLSVCVQHSR